MSFVDASESVRNLSKVMIMFLMLRVKKSRTKKSLNTTMKLKMSMTQKTRVSSTMWPFLNFPEVTMARVQLLAAQRKRVQALE